MADDQVILVVSPGPELSFSIGNEEYLLNVPGGVRLPKILLAPSDGYLLESGYPAGQPPVVMEIIALASPEELSVAEQLMNAARKWSVGSQQEAVEVYHGLIDAGNDAAHGSTLHRLLQYAALYGIAGSSSLYDYQSYQDFLSVLSESNDDSFLQSAVPAIRYGLQVENVETRAVARDQLIQILSSREWPESWAGFEASIYHSIGYSYLLDSQVDLGERYIQQAIDLVSWHSPTLASYYNMLMYADIRRAWLADTAEEKADFLNSSNDTARKGLNYAEQSNSYPTAGLIHNNLAANFLRLGDYENAQLHLRESLRVVEGKFSPFSRTTVLINLGKVYRDLGEWERARSYLNEGIATAGRAAELARIPSAQCVLGTVARHEENLDEALTLHRQCLDEAISQRNTTLQVEAALELSEDLRLAGDLDASGQFLANARALLEANTDIDNELIFRSRAMIRSALISELVGDADEADQFLEAAFSFVPLLLDPIARIEVMYKSMMVYQKRGDHDSVLLISEQALSAVESFFTILEPQRLGPAWSARNYPIVETVLRSQVLAGSEPAEMLQVVERMQSINLRRMMTGNAELAANAERLDLLSDLADQRAEHSESNSEIRRDAYLANELFLVDAWRSTQGNEIEEFSLGELQEQLDSDTAVLRFLIIDDQVFAFTITDSTVSIELTGSLSDLSYDVVETLRELGPGDYSDQNLRSVSGLLPENLNTISAKRLMIVTDGPLNRVPFAMLVDGSGEVLTSRFDIAFAPSLSILSSSIVGPASSDNRLDIAVIADPAIGSAVERLDAPDRVRSWAKTLPRLPWAAEEARTISELFDRHQVVTLTGERATLSALLDERHRRAKILHIATHGYFSDSGADNVGFVLAASDGESENRFVTMTELLSHQFENSLVVVSGCDTSVGETFEGEGSISVTRAFLARGAKSVVGTLWPVSDRASAAFMGVFYQSLSENGDPVIALRAAQEDLRQSSEFSAPIYWAAYRLTTTNMSSLVPEISSI